MKSYKKPYIFFIISVVLCATILLASENAIAVPLGGDIFGLGKTSEDTEIQKAKYYLSQEDFDKSMEIALGILKNDPDNISALRIMVFSLISKRDFENVSKYLNKLQEAAPDSVELILSYANMFQVQEKYGNAINAYHQVLRKENDNVAALFALGTIYEDLNKPALADKYYKQVLELQPGHLGALKKLSFIYLQVKAYEPAMAKAQRAMDLEKGSGRKILWPYWVMSECDIQRGYLEKGRNYITKGLAIEPDYKPLNISLAMISILEHDYLGAETVLKKLKDEASSVPSWGLSMIYGLSKKEYSTAYTLGNTAAGLSPKLPHSDIINANWLLLSKDMDKAQSFYLKNDLGVDLKNGKVSIEGLFKGVKPEDISEYNFCLLLFDYNWLEPARKVLSDLILKNPENKMFNITLAEVYNSLGKREKTKGIFKEMAEKNPDLIYPRLQLSEIAEADKNYQESLKWCEDVRRIAPEMATIYLKLGLLYEEFDKREEAISSYKELIKRIPDFPVGYIQLAWLYGQDDKMLGEAIKLGKKAKSLGPNDPVIAETLGWLYYKNDEYEEAREQLDFALKKRPFDPTFLYIAGKIDMKLGEIKKGKEKLELALKVSEDFPERDEVIELLSN